MRQTSLLAYKQIKTTLGERQNQIYQIIKKLGQPTDMEITKALGYNDPNKVRPRRKELLDLNFIQDAGTRLCTITKRKVHTWEVN